MRFTGRPLVFEVDQNPKHRGSQGEREQDGRREYGHPRPGARPQAAQQDGELPRDEIVLSPPQPRRPAEAPGKPLRREPVQAGRHIRRAEAGRGGQLGHALRLPRCRVGDQFLDDLPGDIADRILGDRGYCPSGVHGDRSRRARDGLRRTRPIAARFASRQSCRSPS